MFKKIDEKKEHKEKVEDKLLTEEKAKQAAINLAEKTGAEWKAINDKGNYVLRTAGLDSAAQERINKINFEEVTIAKGQHGKEMLLQISHPLEILEIAKNNFDLPGPLEEKDPILDKAATILNIITSMTWKKDGRGVGSKSEKIIVKNMGDADKEVKEAEVEAENKKTKILNEFTAKFGSKLAPPTINIKRIPFTRKAESLHTYFSHPLEIQAICNCMAEVIIFPDKARRLYEEVGKTPGQGDILNTFTNDPRPEKFEKALELLNIKVDQIEFNGKNGYKIVINSENLVKLHNKIELHNKDKAEPHAPSPVVRR